MSGDDYTKDLVLSEPDPDLQRTLAVMYGHKDLIENRQEQDTIMEFSQFVRRPFSVEAIQITEENMEEVAELIGRVETAKGITFISLNRRLIPVVHRAYVGWWVTRLDDDFRCYSNKVFNSQFIAYAETITFTFDDTIEEDDAEPEVKDGANA
jgi:hypothetical protein